MAKATVKENKAKNTGNLDRILAAAELLFTRKGFNGTSTRDIAAEAGVSLGNIYNYFGTKEELFITLLGRYEAEYFSAGQPLMKAMSATAFPDNIEALGFASRETVEKFREYILLIYVDVVEFGARHVNRTFSRMRQGYASALKAAPAGKARVARDIDPAGALMMVTWNYFNYFIMEKLFNVKGHYGLADEKAVRLFSRVFRRGILA